MEMSDDPFWAVPRLYFCCPKTMCPPIGLKARHRSGRWGLTDHLDGELGYPSTGFRMDTAGAVPHQH